MVKKEYIILFVIFHILLTIFAIKLSYVSNNNKLNIKSILLPMFAPYIYIVNMYLNNSTYIGTTIDTILKRN